MKKKGFFFGWFRNGGSRSIKEILDDDKKVRFTSRCFHRGFYIENKTGDTDNWKAKVNGNFVTGELKEIKKCVDWWLDMKKFLPLAAFEQKKYNAIKRETTIYKGLILINDNPTVDDWYFLHSNKLYKGSSNALKGLIDRAYVKEESENFSATSAEHDSDLKNQRC